MGNEMDAFFRMMMEKVSIVEEKLSKHEFLHELCGFFGISHGFIYEADYTGNFYQSEYYQIENVEVLAKEIDMKSVLGTELLSELSTQKYIVSTGGTETTTLEEKLNEAFKSKILVFIPILNQHLELAGFIGLSDRRQKVRGKEIDIKNACTVLSLLANSVKMDLFQKGIKNAEKVLNNVLDHVGIDIYVNDFYTHDILYVNKSMAAPYGGVSNMLGKKCWESIFSDKTEPCDFCPQPKLLDENEKPNKTYTWDYERMLDGSWFRVLSSSIPWTDGRIAHIVASVDITESKKNQLLIEKLAQFDYLTGLPNRRSLQDDIECYIADKEAFGQEWYVLFCDLDGFKKINDTIGHNGGDVLLKSIADELKRLHSDELMTYRQGGDEFVVLVKDPRCAKSVKKILNKLLKVFCATYKFEGHAMKCGCSIGAVHYPSDARTYKELFYMADIAMYAAKKTGGNAVRFYHEGLCLDMDEYFKSKVMIIKRTKAIYEN